MKKLILIGVMILTTTLSFSQNVDSLTKKITFQGVISVDGSKSTLYDKGLNWYANVFKSANDAIQIRDKDNGKIVGKYSIEATGSRFGFVTTNITLLFKDGKYKYIITDITYDGNSEFMPWAFEDEPGGWSSHMTKGYQKKIRDYTYIQIQSLIDNLKTYMASKQQSDNF